MADGSPNIRILIADDHPMMVLGIRGVLATQTNIEVVGEASDGREALAKVDALTPDIVVLDISLPDVNGCEVAKTIKREFPQVHVVILSMFDDGEYISQFLDCGASAYVLKNNPPDELLRAVKAVYCGGAYFSPAVSQSILERHRSSVMKSGDGLTERQEKVLALLAQGKSSKQIADSLFISERTVSKYRELIMQRLNLHTVAELTQYAIAKGYIKLNRA
jgi:DNA-binding NarL/FixJ family response regulator